MDGYIGKKEWEFDSITSPSTEGSLFVEFSLPKTQASYEGDAR